MSRKYLKIGKQVKLQKRKSWKLLLEQNTTVKESQEKDGGNLHKSYKS